MRHVLMQHEILAALGGGKRIDLDDSPLVWASGALWRAGCVEVDGMMFAGSHYVTGLTEKGREVLYEWDTQYGKVEV